MNLDTLTPQQRDCVQHVDGPLLVSAGAGSGKTFMLTQRIAYALLNPDISGVNDVDELLAITFTEAAAAEIKARVRNKLREEGLGEQALKVDACWISTIHGMCSRILHENALELGLDPAFGLIDDTDRDAAIADCIEAALKESDAYDALLAEYDTRTGDDAARTMVRELIDAAANVRGGLDAVRAFPLMGPSQIAQEMLDAVIAVDAAARTDVSATGKQGTIAPKIRDMAEGPYGTRCFEQLAATDATYEQVYAAVGNVETSLYSGAKEPFATAVAAFRQTVIDMRLECELGLAGAAREALVRLARDVQGRYEACKRELGSLDQNDLLLKTLDAFEAHPEVRERYAHRFKLVMVDEFQDTSGLQIALISHLTEGDRRLCTVGDAQQSIYRFRGADVATYLQHKRHMNDLVASGGMVRELDKNFRSHGDIISFVNRVFGQERVFDPKDFIKLGFDETHADKPGNAFPAVPRVEVIVTASPRTGGPNTDDRTFAEAQALAERFCALHETGSANCRWADMVILLGGMTNAGVYAQALRDRGVPCTIAGGSGFKTTAEAQAVRALACALANPYDDVQLGQVLAGPAFGLGSDELLGLARGCDGRGRGFWAGLASCAAGERPPHGHAWPARVRLAASVLAHAVGLVGARPLSEAVLEVAQESGWLERLQADGAQGMAQAANFFKAHRLLAGIEDDDPSRGAASTSQRYAAMLDGGLKERPGTLNTDEQDAVRILTIHSSKGLEYPVVALADFYAKPRSGKLTLEGVGEEVLLSLKPGVSAGRVNVKDAPKLTEKMVERLVEAGILAEPSLDDGDLMAGQAQRAIAGHAAFEELAEQRRKFYVGATRPREALIVAVKLSITKTAKAGDDCVGDVRSALFGDGEWRNVPEGIDYGGTTPAVVTYRELGFDEDRNVIVVSGAGAQEESDEPAGAQATSAYGIDGAAVSVAAAVGTAGEGIVGAGASDAVVADAGAAGEGAAGGPVPYQAAMGAGPVPTAPREPSVQDCRVPEAPREGEFLSDLVPLHLPYAPKRAATFSYTMLAVCDKHAAEEDKAAPRPADDDEDTLIAVAGPHHASATAFGSALHQACQLMAEDLSWRRHDLDAAGGPVAGSADSQASAAGPACVRDAVDESFAMPADERLRACLATWDAPAFELGALKKACGMWLASSAARRASGFGVLAPEAPFYVALQGTQGEPIHLEGAFDLLCYDAGAQRRGGLAFIVDYKTGGTAAETAEDLHAKHLLQASCYAYVALCQGFGQVELAFVRVEQPDPAAPGTPQEVHYRFDAADKQTLHETIRAAYARL